MAAMADCPVCHADNPDGGRFCSTCGSALGPLQTREVRKTITVLFADVTGSTALGEQLDPETMRSIMARYFTMMKAVVEHHGGTVEKFIGDAVMAVFGIPQVHEDDALRAVRAAADIRAELARLNTELEQSRRIAIRFRTGVNTGEVVAGDPATGQTLVTGDTVNTAARLEQHAPPGDILIGQATYGLVRDAVEVEPVEPVVAKGKAAPVPAWRLINIRPGEAGRRRRLDAPLVGRERELARLEQAFRQAVADSVCGLFTLLGSAGVGKSRLVAEFTAGLAAEATVLRGHCLSYGEGITYWPIGEIVRSAAGIDEADSAEGARVKLRAMLAGERDADVLAARISSAIGLSAESAPQEEIFWAIRKLIEHLARERPLVVVVEDIHWAEPTLLDLLEHIVDWSRDAPFLILCPARPDLLDVRPGWGGGKLNATTVLLEALPADATGRLIGALPGGSALSGPVLDRVAAAAEGNPLFLEEMLAMLVDDGLLAESPDGTWSATAELAAVRVPASISALLAARLEQLDPAERDVAERASVVGRVFEAAAVSELSEAARRPAVGPSLLALVRKELVRPDRSQLTAGDAFRFRHILIRDAAYAALPKADRAALHERFADWLERTPGERLAELEEIVGHHLEQAHQYRTELGETGPALDALGRRAGERLAAAGKRASERGDAGAAVELLRRAAGHIPHDVGTGRAVRLTLGWALFDLGRLDDTVAEMDRLTEAARTAGEVSMEAQARLLRLQARSHRGEIEVIGPEFGSELDTIQELVEGGADAPTAARYWENRADRQWNLGDFDGAAAATLREIDFATESGDRRTVFEAQLLLGIQLLSGPASVAEAIEQFELVLGSPGLSRAEAAAIFYRLAILRAMEGRFDDARALIARSESVFDELGNPIELGQLYVDAAWVERLAEDLESEIAWLDRSITTLRQAGVEGWIPYSFGRKAFSEARQGAIDRARRDLTDAERDVSYRNAVLCALVRCHAVLHDGDAAGAIREIDEAERLSRETGKFVNVRMEALVEIAALSFRVGQRQRAIDTVGEAIELARAKGNVAILRRAERELAEYRRAQGRA
jgi:class 3 adenylate cyclase/tetratricopeptide (TPR) repeat protein